MEIINSPILKDGRIKKSEIEQVVREKQEYTLLGKYNLTKGFKLFCYNPINGEVTQPKIKVSGFIQCELVNVDGVPTWQWFDPENFNVTIDSRNIYFESLNIKNAINRVKKWKEGKIKELFNLKKPCICSINIFASL